MKNRFYDLPLEIINKVYTFDNTYKEIYDKVVDVIEKFPVFHEVDDKENPGYYVFLREYNMYKNVHIKEYLRVSQKYHFKKAVIIIIKRMSKSNTLIC